MSSQTKCSPSMTDLGLILAGSVLTSFSPVLVAVSGLPPSGSAFYRVASGAVVLFLFSFLRREKLPAAPALYAMVAFIGVLFSANLFAWHSAIELVGPGLATLMGNSQVLFVALFGAAFLKERLTRRFLAALPLALAGLWLLVYSPAEAGRAVPAAGLAFGAATALLYASYILLLRFSRRIDIQLPPFANMGTVCLACAVATFAALPVTGGFAAIAPPAFPEFLAAVVNGIGPQAFGWVIISSGLSRIPASLGGLVLLLQPALAFVWDVLLFGRPTGTAEYIGVILFIGALSLAVTGAGKSEQTC